MRLKNKNRNRRSTPQLQKRKRITVWYEYKVLRLHQISRLYRAALRDTVYVSYATVCSVSWHSSETILSLCSALRTHRVLDISVSVCPLGGQGTLRPVNKAGLPAENKCTVILHWYSDLKQLTPNRHMGEGQMGQSVIWSKTPQQGFWSCCVHTGYCGILNLCLF